MIPTAIRPDKILDNGLDGGRNCVFDFFKRREQIIFEQQGLRGRLFHKVTGTPSNSLRIERFPLRKMPGRLFVQIVKKRRVLGSPQSKKRNTESEQVWV